MKLDLKFQEISRFMAEQKRIDKAIEIVNQNKIIKIAQNLFNVKSQSSNKFYLVDLANESCTCKDWSLKGSAFGYPCKHIIAVRIWKSRNEKW